MKRIHYCKSLLKTQKPIIVLDVESNKETNTDLVEGYGYWRVKYQNAKGKERRRGATTILEVWD